MTWAHLLWCGLWRKPVRTLLTVASLAMTFLLFCLLTPLLLLFEQRGDMAGVQRLIVQPKHSITDFLPLAHAARVAALPGVRATSHQTWFGGTFRDAASVFPRWAVPPASWLVMRPEVLLPADQRVAFIQTRAGAIIGRQTARKYGLKLGDRLTLIPDIWSNKQGRPWEFVLVGIFEGADSSVDLSEMYINYDYFDAYRAWGTGQVSYVLARLQQDTSAADIAAQIDAQFENSADETNTVSERAYAAGFADQLGDVGLMLSLILSAVLFAIAMVAANTMAQSIRERTSELGALRALGFQQRALVGLVLLESLAIALAGAIPGLLAAHYLIYAGRRYIAQLAGLDVDLQTMVGLCAVVLVLAIVAAAPPAWRVSRLRVVDALREA